MHQSLVQRRKTNGGSANEEVAGGGRLLISSHIMLLVGEDSGALMAFYARVVDADVMTQKLQQGGLERAVVTGVKFAAADAGAGEEDAAASEYVALSNQVILAASAAGVGGLMLLLCVCLIRHKIARCVAYLVCCGCCASASTASKRTRPAATNKVPRHHLHSRSHSRSRSHSPCCLAEGSLRVLPSTHGTLKLPRAVCDVMFRRRVPLPAHHSSQ